MPSYNGSGRIFTFQTQQKISYFISGRQIPKRNAQELHLSPSTIKTQKKEGIEALRKIISIHSFSFIVFLIILYLSATGQT